MCILELKQVSYSYDQTKETILHDISTTFEAGKLYCINGKSGAGKSTLLSLIAGLDLPQSGEILCEGQCIANSDRDEYRAKKIGVIFQGYNLLQNATALENVVLAMNIAGKKDKHTVLEAQKILLSVGIDVEKSNRKVLKLSGGEQQRVAIARAISGGAPILAADEPTGNLDKDNEAAIMKILQQLAHIQDKCVIVVTHSKDAVKYADVILEIKNGCLALSEK